jgi:hypothetical protein
VSITNTGFYSIDNLQAGIEIVNSTGSQFLKTSTIPMNIAAGFSGILEIILPLNLTELLDNVSYDFLFDIFPLNLTLTIAADYALQVFHLRAEYRTQEEWIGPLANLSIKVVDTNISFNNAIRMQSVIQVSHDGWLSLNDIPLNITARLANGSELASGFSSFTVVPGIQNNTLSVTFNPRFASMLLIDNASLNLQTKMNLYGYELDYSTQYDWGAPLYGLNITTPKISLVNTTHSKIQTNLSATNYSPIPFGCNATLRIVQNEYILGERTSQLYFPIGILTSIPLSLDITNPTISDTLLVVLELRTPLEVLIYEQYFSI